MKKRCENEIYGGLSLPSVKCYRAATVIKNPGTIYEMSLCDDCANNHGKKLAARARKIWDKLLTQRGQVSKEKINP